MKVLLKNIETRLGYYKLVDLGDLWLKKVGDQHVRQQANKMTKQVIYECHKSGHFVSSSERRGCVGLDN